MRRSLTLFVIAIALLMGVSSRIASADDLTRTVLMKKDLDGSPGKEVTIFIAQYRPGGKSGKHYHPGQEFIHVISGEGTMDETGKPPVEMKPGVQLYFASDPKNMKLVFLSDSMLPCQVSSFTMFHILVMGE